AVAGHRLPVEQERSDLQGAGGLGISGKRADQSIPLRVSSRTPAASRRAIRRKPSCERNQLRRKFAGPLNVAQGPPIINLHIAAVRPAELLQRLLKRRTTRSRFWIVLGDIREHADAPNPVGLLRARRERPGHRAAEQRDERAALHSITSSARASRPGDTVNPSALLRLGMSRAVLR